MKKKLTTQNRPNIGDRILAYGNYNGEINGLEDKKDWYFVEYLGDCKGEGIGGDCYSWTVEDIEYYIELNLD